MTRCSQSSGTDPNAQPADHPPPAQEGAARHKRAWPCQQTPRQRRSVPTPSQHTARRQARHAPVRRPAIRVEAHTPALTPKATPPTDKAGPFTDIIETAAAGASCADASLRHQLNAVPPVRVHMPRPPAPGPGPDISSQIPSHSLRGRGPERRPTRGRVASGQERLPCTMHNPTAPTAFDSRTNALASPAGPGPARRLPRSRSKPGGGRTRGVLPSRALPTAPPPRADAGIRRARTEPAPQLVMRLPAAPARDLATVLSVRRLPNSSRHALRELRGWSAASRLAVRRRLAGQPACVTVQGRHAGSQTGGVSISGPAVDTERPQEAL